MAPTPSSEEAEPLVGLARADGQHSPESLPSAPADDGQLISANRNFEDDPDNVRFRPWEVVRWTEDAGQVRRVAAPEGGEGNLSVEFTGGNSEIQYRVTSVPGELAGRSVTCTIDGIANEPDQLIVQLKAIHGDADEWLNEVRHPGDGKWHTLEFAATVPSGKLPDALLLRVIVNSKNRDGNAFPSDSIVVVDNVSLRQNQTKTPVVAPLPARLQLLKHNRGFEDNPADPNFLPWRVNRWTQDAGKAKRTKAPEGGEGELSLELTGGNVEILYEVRPVPAGTEGRTIAAEIDAIAFAPDQVVLQLKGTAADKEIWLNEASHTGNGEWQRLALKANLPGNVHLDSLAFRVMRQAKDKGGKTITAEGRVLVDNASLIVEGDEDQVAAAAATETSKSQPINLFVSNGGFEDAPDQENILPWQIVRHVKDAGEAVRVKNVEGANGLLAVELTGPNVEVTRAESADASFSGANIAASVECIAHAPQQLVLQVKYRVEDKEEWLFQAEHPGDGQWHKLENNRTLPPGVVPDQIIVRIFRNAKNKDGEEIKAEGRVILDEGKLLVTKVN